jgi:FkbM family methyltransferase
LRYKITPNNGAFGLITGENHFNHPETTDYSIDFIKWRPGDNIHCFGQLMFMHKQNWVPIIDGLDIYFGDDFIFHNHLKRGLDNYLIYNIQFYSPMSQTCKDLSISGGFYEKEKPVWEKYFSENPLTLMDQHHNDPIVRLYHEQVNTPSDINEHLPKLLELAKQCDSITEFGVRHGRSTTAFISSGIKLTSYDIEETVEARMLFDVAKSLGKPCEYIVDPVKGNSLLVDIDETDLLFIDTIHSYEQLSKELAKHHSKVNKFICVHDTHIFGYEWQPHFEWPVYQHFHNQGTHQKGLLHAIIDFLIKHPEWKIKHHSVINNGLTVLQRSVDRLPTPVVADELPEQNNLKKILVAIPTARYIEPETFKAIYDLECPEGCELHFQYFYGYNVDQVRNLIASWVINGFDYLFAVDHDIVFAPDTLVKMVKHNKPLVTGIYRQRLLEQHIEIYDFNLKRIVYEDLPENSLVEIGGCGMGCCLISKEVFVAIEYPHYKYYSALDHNHTFSEDLDFCRKARLKGFSLFCDTSIVCDHHGQTVYRVEKKNVSSSKPSVVNNEEITKRFIELSEMDLLCNEHKNYLWSLKGRGFEPKVIYDIGSSTLHWAKFAREVWPNSKIILFEAMQEVEMLYKLNGFDQYHLGVLSSYNNNGKTIDFYQNLYHPGGNSYYRENVQYSSTADLLFAPEGSKVKKIASSLDSVVKMRNFPEPDLIKIDCQGAELDILNGMEKVKAGIGCRNIIIEAQNIEYNLGAPNKQEVFEFMDQCGYEMVAKITNLQVDNDYHFRLRS